MKGKNILKIFSMLVVLGLLVSCQPAPAEEPVVEEVAEPETIVEKVEVQVKPDKVSLRTNWLYYGSHSIFFYGDELGLYDDQNIDLQIKQGNGSGNAVKLVANKDSTFAYASGAALINQVAQGAPVIAVATIDAAGTDAVICDPDSGITDIKDLEGKTILTTAGAGVNAFWPVVIANAELDESTISLTNVAEAALVSSYLQGLAPCILGGLDDKPAEIEANGGKPPVTFAYSDFGVYQPGYVIVAHQDTVSGNPELVKRFVMATLQAVKAAQEDPDASVLAMANVQGAEAMDETSIAQARKVLGVTLSIVISPNNSDEVLGWNTETDFASALDLFKTYSELETDMTADQFFTNEFVPATLP